MRCDHADCLSVRSAIEQCNLDADESMWHCQSGTAVMCYCSAAQRHGSSPFLPHWSIQGVTSSMNRNTMGSKYVLAFMKPDLLHTGSGCDETATQRALVMLQRAVGGASLCPRAGLHWRGAGSAQPAHLLAGTLAALFTAAFKVCGSKAASPTAGLHISTITPIHKQEELTVTPNRRSVAVGTSIA